MIGNLVIRLCSDLCVGSGDRMNSIIDTDVCFDTNGLPYIPGRRIKGILNENAKDLLSIYDANAERYDENSFAEIFGMPGAEESGALFCDNAYLPGHEQIEVFLRKLGEMFERPIHVTRILESITTLRRQTSITDDGAAKKGSLRNIRVIDHYLPDGEPTSFNAVIKLRTAVSDRSIKLLEDTISLLRHMGTNRTRGLGEVYATCEWTEDTICSEKTAENRNNDREDEESELFCSDQTADDVSELPYSIRLLAPLIPGEKGGVASDIQEYIPGSILLGFFAGEWLQKNSNDRQNAHTNKEFFELFLGGQVSFGQADITHKGIPCKKIPMNILRSKDKSKVFDQLTESDEPRPELKFKHPDGYYEGGDFSATTRIVKLEQRVFRHHSRPADRAVGHATGDGGSVYFQYRALGKNQLFAGTIRGSRTALDKIRRLFGDSGEIHIGRSHSAQYGRAYLSFGNIISPGKATKDIAPGDLFTVFFDSDTCLRDGSGQATADPRNLARELSPSRRDDLSVVSTWLTTTIHSGFKSKWRLPLPQSPAILMGSVVTMKNVSRERIVLPDQTMIGSHTTEGLGRVSIRSIKEGLPDTDPVITKFLSTKASSVSDDEVIDRISKSGIYRDILIAEMEAMVIEKAREDLKSNPGNHSITSNQLSYLRTAIIRSHNKEGFVKELVARSNAGSYNSLIGTLFQCSESVSVPDESTIDTKVTQLQTNILSGIGTKYPKLKKVIDLTEEEKFRLFRAERMAYLTALREQKRGQRHSGSKEEGSQT